MEDVVDHGLPSALKVSAELQQLDKEMEDVFPKLFRTPIFGSINFTPSFLLRYAGWSSAAAVSAHLTTVLSQHSVDVAHVMELFSASARQLRTAAGQLARDTWSAFTPNIVDHLEVRQEHALQKNFAT